MERGENVVVKAMPNAAGRGDDAADKSDSTLSGAEIREWFSSLVWEHRAAVLCIEDSALLATCIEIAMSQTVHHGAHNGEGRGVDQVGKPLPIEDIEKAYISYKKQMAPPSSFALGVEAGGIRQVSSGEETPICFVKDTSGGLAGKRQVGAAVKKCSVSPSSSEPFRIHGSPGSEREECCSPKGDSSRGVVDIMEHTRLVFPDVCDILTEQFVDDKGKSKAARFEGREPVLTFEPEFLESETGLNVLAVLDQLSRAEGVNENFLSDRSCSIITRSSFDWIESLKRMSHSENRIPIRVLLAVRLEVAIVKAYVNMTDDTAVASLNPTTSSVKLDDAKECTTANGRFQSFDRRSSVATVTKRLCTSLMELADKEALSELNLLLSPARQFFNLDGRCEMLPRHLVFLPLSWIFRPMQFDGEKHPALSLIGSCNEVLTTAVRLISDDADGVKATAQVQSLPSATGQSDSKHESDELEPSTGLVTKKNKKKKRKKRKMSNASQVQQVADALFSSALDFPDDDTGVTEILDETKGEASTERDTKDHSVSMQTPVIAIPADVLQAKKFESTLLDKVYRGDGIANAEATAAAQVNDSMQSDTSASNRGQVEIRLREDGKAQTEYQIGEAVIQQDVSTWETVESRTRANRIKKQAVVRGSSAWHNTSQPQNSPAPSSRKGKNRHSSRRRNSNRKIVRDILSSVLDSVDSEIQLVRQKETMAMLEEQKRRHEKIASKAHLGNPYARATTMRDVVLGRRGEKNDTVNPLPLRPSAPLPASIPNRTAYQTAATGARAPPAAMSRSNYETRSKQLRLPVKGSAAADQNTAATVPETLSGMSANTMSSSLNTDGVPSGAVDADSSSNGDAMKIHRIPAYREENNDVCSPPPPLQTLLGPNENSASSSVASSLEAPHTSHHHHHASTPNKNDVGYHLLDVCSRLSRDMDVFMQRRASALIVRRRERGALLAALQDTTRQLWPGKCHVEMYGSCATQLDLPSSDVDAVICGLGPSLDTPLRGQPLQQGLSKKHDQAGDVTPVSARSTIDQAHLSPFISPYSPPVPLAPNAERVLRLAGELERQPWAVQVKAIPTASVPVVKILADPSRLPGAVSPVASGGDWLMHQHMAAQAAAAAAGMGPPPPLAEGGMPQASRYAPSQVPHFPGNTPPWRGSDVMNGLFSVDITFEGPEHGGIGSTAFSAQVVQDACNETGLPPDRTPVVQVLMVLKELLAQRRLNEPFSGGMSSYGLLLLVVAVLKDRQAIREELEKIERQRLVVASESAVSCAADDSTTVRSNVRRKAWTELADNQVPPSIASDNSLGDKAPQTSKTKIPSPGSALKLKGGTTEAPSSVLSPGKSSVSQIPSPKPSSSWASIARKNSGAPAPKPVEAETSQPSCREGHTETSLNVEKRRAPKAATFADIVNNNKSKGARPSPPTPHEVEVSVVNPAQTSTAKSAQKASGGATKSEATSFFNKECSISKDLSSDPTGFVPSSAGSSFCEPSRFPQGTNDILEVLCSAEMTAGKLLMHCLLFYGQHFDSPTSAIDVSGTHHPDYHHIKSGQSLHLTPFVPRKPGGSIDPVTGMLTVDPIVVYDPLEGAEHNNVARSCFAWNSIRWVFAQSYMTLASVVERSETPPTTPTMGNKHSDETRDTATYTRDRHATAVQVVTAGSKQGDGGNAPGDMVSPLLEMLLSF